MKAYLIDSAARAVREVETDGTDASLKSLIGMDASKKMTRGARRSPNSGEIAVEYEPDNGRGFFTLPDDGKPFMGNAVVLGSSTSIQQLRREVRFVDAAKMNSVVEYIKAAEDEMKDVLRKHADKLRALEEDLRDCLHKNEEKVNAALKRATESGETAEQAELRAQGKAGDLERVIPLGYDGLKIDKSVLAELDVLSDQLGK